MDYFKDSGRPMLRQAEVNVGSESLREDIPGEVSMPEDLSALYMSTRYSKNIHTGLGYNATVPHKGIYSIILHFADIFEDTNQVGKRTFDIFVNERKVYSNYDIYKMSGGNMKASRVAIDGIVVDETNLALRVMLRHTKPKANNPMLNAVEVFSGSDHTMCELRHFCDESPTVGNSKVVIDFGDFGINTASFVDPVALARAAVRVKPWRIRKPRRTTTSSVPTYPLKETQGREMRPNQKVRRTTSAPASTREGGGSRFLTAPAMTEPNAKESQLISLTSSKLSRISSNTERQASIKTLRGRPV